MDQGQLDALYQQYLGRGVDPSGASTWANADYNTVVQGILGSQEYQNRQNAPIGAVNVNTGQTSGPATNQGGGDINSIYQQYLGRGVDPSGAATYAGWNPQDIVNAILGSQEYQQRTGTTGGGAGQAAPTQEPPPDWLNPADYVANGYAAPYTQQQITKPVDSSWIRQMNGQTYASVKGPSDLSGGEYLVDPNTGKFVLDANGKPVGVTYPQSNGFSDWVTTPLGGLAMTFGIPLAAAGGVAALEGLGAFGGAGTALETTGAGGLAGGGAFTPAAGSGANFSIIPGAAYTTAGQGALTTAELLKGAGGAFTPAAGSGANFGIVPGATYGISELAAASALANAGMSASQIANYAKTGLSLAGVASKLLGGSGSTGTTGTTGINPNALANALKGLSGTGTGTGSQLATNFNLVKGNVNPFSYGKEIPVQAQTTNKADPFAALNVAQTPVQPINPLAHLFG